MSRPSVRAAIAALEEIAEEGKEAWEELFELLPQSKNFPEIEEWLDNENQWAEMCRANEAAQLESDDEEDEDGE